MKKNILMIIGILLSNCLFGFLENINFEQNLDHCAGYISTFAIKDDKLYVDSRGTLECYNIQENGALEFNSYLPKYYYQPPVCRIFGDSLYIVDCIPDETYYIKAIDISGDAMYETNSLTIEWDPEHFLITNLQVNEDYLFYYTQGPDANTVVIDRTTFDYITEIETEYLYTIRDKLLFTEVEIGTESFLSISDISDVHNPVEMSNLLTGNSNNGYDKYYSFLFYENVLIIGRMNDILIIDISDLENPFLVSVINDIPNIPVLPAVNFFISLLIKDNYLVASNNYNSFWIYDISDISEPVFVNYHEELYGDCRDNLILNENSIYQGSMTNSIRQIDANSLPAINFIEEFGKPGFFNDRCLCYPYLIYTDYSYNDQKSYYFDVRETNPEISVLSDFVQYFFCKNDSLMFSISNDYPGVHINIFHYNEEDVILLNRVSIQNTYFTKFQYLEPFIYTVEDNTNLLRIYSINEDYSLELIHTDNLGSMSFFSEQSEYTSNEYVFIEKAVISQFETMITVLENSPPFNEVSSFSLFDFFAGGPGRQDFYLLSDNRALIVNKLAELYHEAYLCEFTFPDELEIIDEIYIKSDFVELYDHYFSITRCYDGIMSYYNWQNDELELEVTHDFELGIRRFELIPELSKLYAVGAFIINEYSCDYVSVEDNTIPQPESFLSNYPNPFNPETKIVFNLLEEGNVKLEIYNIKGQKVKTLLDCYMSPGHSEMIWNGRDDKGKRVSSGVYFYQLVTEKKIITKKMMLIK